uniref:Uncharacterized protein n=1 Tax=Podoviridae sp. ctG4L18 TaxID=2825234 RepID=A0A8S5UPL1_9CAUD|nr:MAG TPA: hypothetical protein [Podoviridae sp. ctG4L18]
MAQYLLVHIIYLIVKWLQIVQRSYQHRVRMCITIHLNL